MSAKKFYANAQAYDLAFSDREFDTECDFLIYCLEKYGKLKNQDEKSYLEMACGPARHAREFAKRGWRSVGLDISEDMIAYAFDETKKENLNVEYLVADMVKFKLNKKVALATTLMESIAHLVTNEQMVAHFKSVAKNLKKGGLYIIEATHPMFFFPDGEANTWKTRVNGTHVEVTFGLPTDHYDSVTQQWMLTSKLHIKQKNGADIVTEARHPVRWYLAQEMRALIELSGVWSKYWFFGSMYFTPPKPLDDSEDSDAMVIVLRK
ncbi:MAG: class I SAM-dependent methyltransferase [Melioribacteraceae bacterium]|nr:class I SAM-dependent methyltransferase [Melioribacteraceae bacterium]